MTIVLKVKDGKLVSLYNIRYIKRSKRDNCDHCGVDTFNREFHFSDIQIECIRG